MRSVTAYDLSKELQPKISWGCPILDRTIGRLPVGGINEISGEAGSGKTQLCLSLCLQCRLTKENGGIDGAAAYLSCGEGEFPIRRLQQLASTFEARLGVDSLHLLEGIHIEQYYCIEDVIESLKGKIPSMCRLQGIRLLIIDSLAGLIRSEYNTKYKNEMIERTKIMFVLAETLKWISNVYKLCIIVVNQASATGFDALSAADSINIKPALGLAWTTCVNSRIMLLRNSMCLRSIAITDESTIEASNNQIEGNLDYSVKKPIMNSGRSLRRMSLEFSPIYASTSCNFEITSNGARGYL